MYYLIDDFLKAYSDGNGASVVRLAAMFSRAVKRVWAFRNWKAEHTLYCHKIPFNIQASWQFSNPLTASLSTWTEVGCKSSGKLAASALLAKTAIIRFWVSFTWSSGEYPGPDLFSICACLYKVYWFLCIYVWLNWF